MGIINLKNKILELLKISSIPLSDKEMVEMVLPVMKDSALNKLYKALTDEKAEMGKLEKKQERIEMKYQIMTENLAKMSQEGQK